MKTAPAPTKLVRVREETFTSDAFVRVYDRIESNISRATIVPPTLGKDWGGVRVTYKTPILKPVR